MPRGGMRLLHAGTASFHASPAERERQADGEADPQSHCGKYLPLHRLPKHFEGHSHGGRRNGKAQPMEIKFNGDFSVQKTPQEVYDFLVDPNRFCPLLPDYQSMEILDAKDVLGKVSVGVSHIRFTPA